MGSCVKRILESLCCKNGWSYGVFWTFDQRNSMLLTVEDAYYIDEMHGLMDSILLQGQMLGEGMIGEAAFTGKHKWLFSEVKTEESCSFDYIQSENVLQTIAVIPLKQWGVLQFGSTKKIPENLAFLDEIEMAFQEVRNNNEIFSFRNTSSSSDRPADDLNELFASLSSFSDSYGNFKFIHSDLQKELLGSLCSVADVNTLSSYMSEDFTHLNEQLEKPGIFGDAYDIINQNPASLIDSAVKDLPNENPCISASSGTSVLTSLRPPVSSDVALPYASNLDDTSLNSSTKKSSGESTTSSLCSSGGLVEKNMQRSSGDSVNNQQLIPSVYASGNELPKMTGVKRSAEELKPVDPAIDFSSSSLIDNLSQWFTDTPDPSFIQMATSSDDGLSHSAITTTLPSVVVQGECNIDFPVEHSNEECLRSLQEKPANVNSLPTDLYDNLKVGFGSKENGNCWEDLDVPIASDLKPVYFRDVTECTSKQEYCSMSAPKKGLFSELGIEELLGNMGHSITRSGVQSPAARRMGMEGSPFWNMRQVQCSNYSCSGSMSSDVPMYESEQAKEALLKSHVGLWIDDSYSVNAGGSATQQRRTEEPAKTTRKRARPGESTRPRPKDRQQIQDRLKELRGIIPNGSKCSIDALLDRTVKHMLFLQNVTKHADKLKQAAESMMETEGNGGIFKENTGATENEKDGSVGKSWAFEVGSQSTMCPIKVEDLSPGLMLIEMHCDDQGIFLEIADIIRGFGLNILKGIIEVRDSKMWSHFVVEANRQVTRMDLIWSLVPLLQQTTTNRLDTANDPCNLMDGECLVNNYEQSILPHTISIMETLQ